MKAIRSFFRSPVALGGAIAAAIVLSVGAVAVATSGFSQAQETPVATATPGEDGETPTTKKAELRDDFLNGLADNLGITRAELDAALQQTSLDMVDQALADGKITDEEATRIREAIESGNVPFFGPGFGHHRPHPGAHIVNQVADFLGVDPQVVVDGLQNDQSLAQIAEANGKTRDELRSYLLSQLDQRLDNVRQNAEDHIDDLIDHQGLPERPFKDGPGGFGPGGHMDEMPFAPDMS